MDVTKRADRQNLHRDRYAFCKAAASDAANHNIE